MFLLSLHEVYFQRMLSGEKLFEFRKRIPAELKSGDELAIYCTKPTCRIVAYAEVGGVLKDTPSHLWARTRYAAGIDKDAFMDYFGKARNASAIIIKKIHQLAKPISMIALRGSRSAPQSFIYLTNAQAKKVRAKVEKSSSHGVMMFVGGVHGVGKTTVCKTSLDSLGFDYVSASELIRRRVTLHRTDKRVRNVEGNQTVLVQESNKEKTNTLLYGLDGHYCLLNKDGAIERLPIELFRDLGVDLFVLIEAPVDVVVRHLQKRDGTTWTRKTVCAMLSAERTHAKRIAKTLNKPLIVLDSQKKKCAEKVVAGLEKALDARRTVAFYKDPRLR